jgi:hypothetical protein
LQWRCVPYKADRTSFEYIKRHVPLKELVLWLSSSLWGQFLREICPRKKYTPKSGAFNGTITGILLISLNVPMVLVLVFLVVLLLAAHPPPSTGSYGTQ